MPAPYGRLALTEGSYVFRRAKVSGGRREGAIEGGEESWTVHSIQRHLITLPLGGDPITARA